MPNPRSESIRPIVDQDLVVVPISKWLGVPHRERWARQRSRRWQRRPFEPFCHDKVGNTAIGGFGLGIPFDIAPQVRGPAFENAEIVLGYCWSESESAGVEAIVMVHQHTPMISPSSSHVCGWNSSSVMASTARSTSVSGKGGQSSTGSAMVRIRFRCRFWRIGRRVGVGGRTPGGEGAARRWCW